MPGTTAVKRSGGIPGWESGPVALEENPPVLRAHREQTRSARPDQDRAKNTLCVPLDGKSRADQSAPITNYPNRNGYEEFEEEENEQVTRPDSPARPLRRSRYGAVDQPQAVKRTRQRKSWSWHTGPFKVAVVAAGIYLLLFFVVALCRGTYYRLAYGPSPVTENHSIVTGDHDSAQQPSDVLAYTANGRIVVTIAPGGNFQQSVMVEGPQVSGSPVVFLAQGNNQTITVQIVQPASLFDWFPAPYTFSITWATNGFQVIPPNQ
jgi:hypothetical protein